MSPVAKGPQRARDGQQGQAGDGLRGSGQAGQRTAARGRAAPTCLSEADDLGDGVVGRGPGARLPVQAGDLDAAVLPHLAGVQLAQRRDHGRLGHGVRDVGPVPHLQPAQDVPLHRLQEIPVHLARLLGPPEAAGGACVLRGAPGGSRRGRGGGGSQQQQPAGQQRGQHPPASRPVHGGGAGGRAGAGPERRREPVCRQRRSERSAARRGRRQPSRGPQPLRAGREGGGPGEAACAAGEAEGGGRPRRQPKLGREGEKGGERGGGGGAERTERPAPRGRGTAAGEGVAAQPGEGGRGSGAGGARGAGSWGRRRRAAPGPRGASEGHPRAPPLVVHRSLRQGPGGPRRELFSPASLRGVREITEADLYTIQFIAWKEEGGWGGEMPLVPPRPLRPRKTTIHRPWVRVSEPLRRAPLAPSFSARRFPTRRQS